MDLKELNPRPRNQRNTKEGSSETHLKEGEEKWLDLSTSGMKQAPTRLKRITLHRRTKALTVRWPTGARNREREEEEGGREEEEEEWGSALFGQIEAK